ncbi:hypothetical protein OBBRIDRAFT_244494 [Obba rivulosa]|uniref:Uncharacterized protein n=1 Tax=Obba rivulosa TaxID=1052685 RepID=A0A8E2AQP9_9APHY|nr:hypothetical protein OBBRIDRAFT_244494 [Obba rivulosa]
MDAYNERIHRVIFVESNRSQWQVYDVFSQCGKILATHAWKADRYATSCFVEFCHSISVKRARALQLPDTEVQVVSFDLHLIANFESVAPSPPPAPARMLKQQRIDDRTPPPSSKRPRFDNPSRPSSRQVDMRMQATTNALLHSLKSPSVQPSSTSSTPLRARMGSADASFSFKLPALFTRTDSDKENDRRAVPSPYEMHVPLASAAHTATFDDDSIRSTASPGGSRPPTSHKFTPERGGSCSASLSPLHILSDTRPPAGIIPSPHVAFHTPEEQPVPRSSPSIVLNYNGEHVSCALENLDENPGGIIAVLKATAGHSLERDKWMIVAGYYRGKGNVKAAVAVVSTMVEVMTSPTVGLASHELKPAYLMLASCHTDLGKQARLSPDVPVDVSQEHYQKASAYLQQVYGMFAAEAPAPPVTDPRQTEAAIRIASPLNMTLHEPRPSSASTAVASPSQHDRAIPSKASPDPRIQSLEREVQSLRDRHTHATRALASARESKRQLEDELASERSVCRRAERSLKSATDELASTRRTERFALDQSRRDVEARRRAEAERDEARALLEDASARVERAKETERKARECFGKLGVLFMGAARGDVDGAMLGADMSPALGQEGAPRVREGEGPAGSAR